jgi:hypothetical protein
MIRVILCVLALMLIVSGAFAQSPPSRASVPGSSSTATGSASSIAQTDVDTRHGSAGGVERIQDPYNTSGAASLFGTSAGMANVQNPSGAGVAPQNNPYPYGVKPR